MTLLLNGAECAQLYRRQLAEVVAAAPRSPGLAVVLVGDDPASASYVKGKEDDCRDIGIRAINYRMTSSISQTELLSIIDDLNKNDEVDGILVQLPLPRHIDEALIINAIAPEKDVDGFSPANVGRMVLDQGGFVSCTPLGVLLMLKHYKIETRGKHVVICGRSNIVGKPMANLLLRKDLFADATVTVCHSKTADLRRHTLSADIIVAAMGVPQFIRGDMIKEGAVVIDVGMNRIPDSSKKSGFRLVGDVNFEECSQKASAITPVPGGVGPMTRLGLMYNTVESAKRRGAQ